MHYFSVCAGAPQLRLAQDGEDSPSSGGTKIKVVTKMNYVRPYFVQGSPQRHTFLRLKYWQKPLFLNNYRGSISLFFAILSQTQLFMGKK